LPSRLQHLARCQDGLITRSQSIATGVTAILIDGQLRSGRWTRVLPGVYSTDRRPVGPNRFIRATYLWAGPGSVIEGAAALIWQRRSDRSLAEVTVSAGRNLRPQAAAWPITTRRHTMPE